MKDDEVVNIQPLLNWLRVAGCKERHTQRSRTDTPITINWIPTFLNDEESKWATRKLVHSFGTECMGNGNNRNSKRKTYSTDGKRKRDTNLETDYTTKAIAVILEHTGMVNKKVKNTTTVSSTTTEKWVNTGKFV